jgi:C_GCAxxG_C_C family probable redox protein
VEEQDMSLVEDAVSVFNGGFLCSQALLSTYGVKYGIGRETALKVSAAFGGGISRMGKTCGAVTGALMVIGLKYGRVDAKDQAAREKTYGAALQFAARFSGRHGSIRCKDLLGYDLSKPEEYARARDEKLFHTACPQFVRDAAKILEEILKDEDTVQ